MKFRIIPLKRIKVRKNHSEDMRYPEYFAVVEELRRKKKSLHRYYVLLRGVGILRRFRKDGFDCIGCLVFREYDIGKAVDRFVFTISANENGKTLKLFFPSSYSYIRIFSLLENVGGKII